MIVDQFSKSLPDARAFHLVSVNTDSTCPLHNAVNDLCKLARDKTPALAFVSLSEAVSYFPYPLAENHIDYIIVPVDNCMTQVIRSMSAYIVSQLLQMIKDNVMNVVLPLAFGTNANAQDFDWVPRAICGVMWSNYQFVDAENNDENFTHMVPVAPPTVPINAESTGPGSIPKNDSHSISKATEKCKVKSSMKSWAEVADDSSERQKPNEVGVTTGVATATVGGDTLTSSSLNSPMVNQACEIVCCLFHQSKILDECRVRVARAVGKAVSEHSTQLYLPFTSYISSVSDAVEVWHMRIMVIHPEMAHCDYDMYCICAVDIIEKTQEYFGRLQDLNTILKQQMTTPKPVQTVKPSSDHDSGMGSSSDSPVVQAHDTPTGSTPIKMASTDVANPFPEEIMCIMQDVESSVEKYVQAMTMVVTKYLGGIEVTAYLGHIFSTGLNFQTSMWQLVMTGNDEGASSS